MHRLNRDDRGFTLIEMLIAVVLLSVIIVPLATALVGFYRSTNGMNNRMSESHDVQIASAYFNQDVQSIGAHDWPGTTITNKQSIDVPPFTAVPSFACGTAGAGTTELVRFRWDNPPATPAVVAPGGTRPPPSESRVSYMVVGGTGTTERQLHRYTCTDSPTVTSDTILVHNLDKDQAGFPTITCAATDGTTVQACAALTAPATVILTLKIKAVGNADALTTVLTAQRRQA